MKLIENCLSQFADIPASEKCFFKFLTEERKVPEETVRMMVAEKVCIYKITAN